MLLDDQAPTASNLAEVETAEHSQWIVMPNAGITRRIAKTPQLPSRGPGQDDYPLMQPGTPSMVSPELAEEVSRNASSDWFLIPTPRRRREPRYRVQEDRVWIQWWHNGEFNGISATLVNVSRHGAMIVAPSVFDEKQPLRITLEDPEQPYGVDALVLGLIEEGAGLYKIRLGFLTPCPDPFFSAVASGFEAWLNRRRSH